MKKSLQEALLELEELLVTISLILPYNQGAGYKLNQAGCEYLKGRLELFIAENEMTLMTAHIPIVVTASDWADRFFKAAYDIADNLSKPFKDDEGLAKCDEAMLKILSENPGMEIKMKKYIDYIKKDFEDEV